MSKQGTSEKGTTENRLFSKLLVANRGEIAIRIMRTAANLGIPTLGVYSQGDSDSLHAFRADESVLLSGEGAAAYLNVDNIISTAKENGCDAVHPGYGFLSEQALFASACEAEGIKFVGPSARSLALFGDKVSARKFAMDHGVPVLSGTSESTSLEAAQRFFEQLDGRAMMIKASAGGGGRGVRIVSDIDELESAFSQCAREARSAFGNDALYVEEYMSHARHIEVQILGDKFGEVIHLGERDCSLQRRHQKIIEMTPAPHLSSDLRNKLVNAALTLAKSAQYENAGTVEFLVDTESGRFAFIEVNARLQVEHTITEEVFEVDLVEAQLRIAKGEGIKQIGLEHVSPRGVAIQLRINMETMGADGSTSPAGGTLRSFNPPGGRGIRLDTYAYSDYSINPRFDSLLAKLIVHHRKDDFRGALANAYRALCEFQIDGVATNLSFLQNLLTNENITEANFYTRFIDDNIRHLVVDGAHQQHYRVTGNQTSNDRPSAKQAGATLDNDDPLAVLDFGQQADHPSGDVTEQLDDSWVLSPMQGTIIEVLVEVRDEVSTGSTLAIMDSMKMEHEIKAAYSGVIESISATVGETLWEQQPILSLMAKEVHGSGKDDEEDIDLDYIRPDLQEVVNRRAATIDANRPTAVARH